LGALIDLIRELKQVYIDTARATGFTSGPEHFGYQGRALVADTDAEAQELGQGLLWNAHHRMRGHWSATILRATSPGRPAP
jgi:hypothetical protein